MLEPLLLSSGKREVVIDPPIMNSAGFLGFSEEAVEFVDLGGLGALITHPLSSRSRSPARDASVQRNPGGFLLHTGLPNPGVEVALATHRRRWRSLPCPVIVHLIAQSAEQLEDLILRLEGEPVLSGLEVGLDNPAMVEGFAQLGHRAELPIILRLPLDWGTEAFLRADRLGAMALSVGPPRGHWHDPRGHSHSGRYYGPALLPLAASLTHRLAGELKSPLIVGGGVGSKDDVHRLLKLGASAVQLDYPLWLRPEEVL